MDLTKTAEALKKRGYEVSCFSTGAEAAAPLNAERHGYKTPCAIKKDRCYDCRSPQRICSAQTIYWRKMNHTEMEVVLIDEDMGY